MPDSVSPAQTESERKLSDALETIESLSERVVQIEEERDQCEQALRRNYKMFEALLRNCSEGIALTGPDRRIVRVVKGLTGMEPGTLAGALVESFAAPEDQRTIVDAYTRLLRDGCGQVVIRIRLVRGDGTTLPLVAKLTDMLDNPNVYGIVWNYSVVAGTSGIAAMPDDFFRE